MGRCFLACLLFFITGVAFSQQVSITGFTVKNQLPGDVSQWKADAVNAVIQGSSVPGAVSKPVKLVVQIRKGGSFACGNNIQTAQTIDNLTARPVRASDVVSLLGNCNLQPGQYSLCIQIFNADNRSVAEQCREFTVADEGTYSPPTLVAPANGTALTLAEIKKPITFRWTPVVPPPPNNNVVYHIRVYEVLQGQVATQAIKTNSPVFEKDVNTTQIIWQAPAEYTTAKDTKNFAWTVQATTKNGKGYGANNGTSEHSTFSISSTYSIDLQNLVVNCPKNNNYGFTIQVGNPNATTAIFDKLEVVMINGSLIAPINIPTTTPPIGTTIPATGSITVSASFNYATTVNIVCIKAYIKEQANPTLNTAATFICDTLKCACDPCKDIGVTVTNDTLSTKSFSSNEITISGVLSGLDPNKVKKVTMELVYFNIIETGDKECAKCAANKEWGNFTPPASASFTGFGNGTLNGGNFGREWTWISNVQKECNDSHGGGTGGDTGGGTGLPNNPSNAKIQANNPIGNSSITGNPNNVIIIQQPPVGKANSFSLPISVPPGSSLSCCGDKIRVCIRFTVWDFCCHACDVVKCYEIERKPK